MKLISLIFFILLGVQVLTQEYIVPEATIEILHPKGFKVSIPDDGKIKLFAFHGKINEEFNGPEAGIFSRDILVSQNGRWTFIDKKTTFKEGDIIYYWLYVIDKNGLGHLKEDEHYTVTMLTEEYIVPEATIEILHPKGFKVSIPDDGKIKLFAFHGKINKEFNGNEAGMFSRDIVLSQNGRWTFIDKKTTFKEGDVIYYWLYVIDKNGLGHLRKDEHYTVTSNKTDSFVFPTTDPVQPLKPKPEGLGLPIIASLTNSELQRHVLLEQLDLIRLQKEYLTPLNFNNCPCLIR